MIIEKLKEDSKIIEFTKQEGTASPLLCACCCNSALLSKTWFKAHKIDFNYIVWGHGNSKGFIVMNNEVYKKTTEIEIKELLKNKLTYKNKCLKRFEKNVKKLNKEYPKYHPKKLKKISKKKLKSLIIKKVNSMGILLRDTVFCESFEKETLKKILFKR